MKGRTDVIVGVQWGDEGKGRVVDALAGRSGVVVRSGGANAGHTVVVEDEKYVFRLPLGDPLSRQALRDRKQCCDRPRDPL